MMKKAPIGVLFFLAVTEAFTNLHITTPTFSQTRAYGRENDMIEFADVSRFFRENSIFGKFTKQEDTNEVLNAVNKCKSILGATALSLMLSFWVPDGISLLGNNQIANASDGAKIATCLFKKCPLQLGKCIANPNCLANVICINTCNGRPDESECQIECGNTFENTMVGEFNKCAVSDMDCVPQKQDDGSYPIPAKEKTVQNFDTKFFEGKLYITAGQNKLFDIFPCQVHFFTNTAPGKFFGKLNWRINEPDGEFFTRDALQRFVQDENWPAHMVNHDNDYLHYEDDWYILDAEMPGNSKNIPPFALIYYRGSNDAWVGYGGAFVYTQAASLPEELLPRLREATQKVNFDFDKDFTITDNTCQVIGDKEKLLLREQFAGKVAIQTEQQLQSEVVRVRGTASNNIKAQKMLINNELGQASSAFDQLSKKAKDFEEELVKDAELLEKELEKDLVSVEKEVEKEIIFVEKEVEKDIMKVEKEVETDIKKVVGSGKK